MFIKYRHKFNKYKKLQLKYIYFCFCYQKINIYISLNANKCKYLWKDNRPN